MAVRLLNSSRQVVCPRYPRSRDVDKTHSDDDTRVALAVYRFLSRKYAAVFDRVSRVETNGFSIGVFVFRSREITRLPTCTVVLSIDRRRT